MKKQESGRSMVEMLGVLAIIGVLSVGGISGYMLSINRFRANNMLDKAGKFATIAFSTKKTAEALGKPIDEADILYDSKALGALDTTSGEAIELAYDEDTSAFLSNGTVNLFVTFASQDICETAMSILGEKTDNCIDATAEISFKQN